MAVAPPPAPAAPPVGAVPGTPPYAEPVAGPPAPPPPPRFEFALDIGLLGLGGHEMTEPEQTRPGLYRLGMLFGLRAMWKEAARANAWLGIHLGYELSSRTKEDNGGFQSGDGNAALIGLSQLYRIDFGGSGSMLDSGASLDLGVGGYFLRGERDILSELGGMALVRLNLRWFHIGPVVSYGRFTKLAFGAVGGARINL